MLYSTHPVSLIPGYGGNKTTRGLCWNCPCSCTSAELPLGHRQEQPLQAQALAERGETSKTRYKLPSAPGQALSLAEGVTPRTAAAVVGGFVTLALPSAERHALFSGGCSELSTAFTGTPHKRRRALRCAHTPLLCPPKGSLWQLPCAPGGIAVGPAPPPRAGWCARAGVRLLEGAFVPCLLLLL